MTYCVAAKLTAGLVFISDTRTNAGIDHIATFRKLHVFGVAGERLIVLQSAGNLATSQAVISLLQQRLNTDWVNLNSVKVGAIDVLGVEAVVVEGSSPTDALLGMSFLSRVSWREDQGVLKLESKI